MWQWLDAGLPNAFNGATHSAIVLHRLQVVIFLNLSVVPQYNQSHTEIACTDFTARYQAVNFINNVRACFTMELRDLDMEDVSRDSVQKNSLSDPSNFNVLAQDQQFVLKVLDKAITKGNIGPEL